ncbi:MAG: RES family NAD+ phosphorylase [Candidatus Eremiobacteraeota bacterium]|nr:RES family NAD+ phosphorylase [Candidatus Eremiobacteraeota bacterium]
MRIYATRRPLQSQAHIRGVLCRESAAHGASRGGAIIRSSGLLAVPKRAMLILDVSLSQVLDLRDLYVQAELGVSASELHKPWLRDQDRGRFPLTQRIGEAARSERFEAIIAPSDADRPHGWNLVIIPEAMRRTSYVSSMRLLPTRLAFVPETLRGRISP